jgi:hypothetical protein
MVNFHEEYELNAAQAIVSIGDEGVLNTYVSLSLSDVWLDRDLSWLGFNDRFDEGAVPHPKPGNRDPVPARITHESSPLSVTLLLEAPL